MADDQETSNDMVDENPVDDYVDLDGNDANDGINPNVPPTTTELPQPQPQPAEGETQPPYEPYNNDGGNPFQDEYEDDEPLPDVTVKLLINGDGDDAVLNPDGLVTDIVNAGITDEIGKLATTTPSITDAIDGYTAAITQQIYDGINTNGTAIEEKRWWGKFI